MSNPGGIIYAIGAVGTSWVKTAGPVLQRLQTLQSGQPFPLQVLASIPVETDARRIEKQVDAFLEAERRRGEWFDVAMDSTHLEALVVRAVQYIAEQEEIKRLRQQAQEVAKRRVLGVLPQLHGCTSIGERLKRLRPSRGMTLRQLAGLAHVPQSTLSSVETGARAGGKLTLETGKRLARALGISLDVIAGVYEEEEGEMDADATPPAQPTKRQRTRKAASVA
jgi:transcriptional regulator with XRE-family HTH domain